MNPYWGSHFFEFFAILFTRCFLFLTGTPLSMQADELQIGVMASISIACGLLGPFLVLKRMSMFANALSHTILLGIISTFLIVSSVWGGNLFDLTTLLIGSFCAALLTAAMIGGIIRYFHLQEDASIGLVFSTLFALGVLLVTLFTRNVHLSVEMVMGNADALSPSDFSLAASLAGLNLVVVFLFYRQLQISSFDPHYATALGIRSGFFHFLLLCLASAVCMGAFRAVGVFLVLAFLVGPYLTARLFSHRLSVLLFLSPAFGIAASLFGVALSRHILSLYGLPLSTGGLVVCMIGVLYSCSLFMKWCFRVKLCKAQS